MGSPGFWAGAFLMSSSIVTDWVELLRKLFWFVFMELGGLGIDTVFVGVFHGGSRQGQRQEQEQATAKAKYRDLSTARWTMRLSSASVEMTFVVGERRRQATAKTEADPY